MAVRTGRGIRRLPPGSDPKFGPGDLVKFKTGYNYQYPVAGTLGEVRDNCAGERFPMRIKYRRGKRYTGWVYPVYSLNLGIIRYAREIHLEHLPPLEDEAFEEEKDVVRVR